MAETPVLRMVMKERVSQIQIAHGMAAHVSEFAPELTAHTAVEIIHIVVARHIQMAELAAADSMVSLALKIHPAADRLTLALITRQAKALVLL